MMRSRPLSKLRSYLLPAVAAILLAVGPMACSSSGEESPNPALDGAASGEETNNANSASSNSESNAAAVNANTEASNTDVANSEGGEAAPSNNPIGNELNNAIANEGGAAPTEGAAPENGGGLNADANAGAALNGDSGAANPVAGGVDANTTNPFAATSEPATPPNNATPTDPSAPADGGMGGMAATPSEPVPVDSGTGAAATGSAGAPAPAPTDGASATAAGATGPTSLPEMGAKMAYYVMRGDTLGSIAQKIYGSRKKWKALQAENGLADANKIYPGDVLYFTLDESTKGFAEKYELGQRQAYTVSRGDTLSRLAAKFYGTQGAWRALWKENPQILNPDRIRVGMVLSYRAVNKVAFKDEREAEEEVRKAASSGDEAQGDESNGATQASAEESAAQFTAAAE